MSKKTTKTTKTTKTPKNKKELLEALQKIAKNTLFTEDKIFALALIHLIEEKTPKNRINEINEYISKKDEEHNKRTDKKKKTKCLFQIKGHCNSDYGNKMKCDGLHIPKKCPWKFHGSYAMAVSDFKNRRKK